MRKLKLALAALAISAFAVTSAQAQDKDTTGVRAGMADKPTVASLVAAINATPTTTETLKARTDITAADIQLVNVRELGDVQNDSTFKAAWDQHQGHAADLRAALSAQAGFKEALAQTPGVTAEDVVAVQAGSTGKVVVFYHGKGM